MVSNSNLICLNGETINILIKGHLNFICSSGVTKHHDKRLTSLRIPFFFIKFMHYSFEKTWGLDFNIKFLNDCKFASFLLWFFFQKKFKWHWYSLMSFRKRLINVTAFIFNPYIELLSCRQIFMSHTVFTLKTLYQLQGKSAFCNTLYEKKIWSNDHYSKKWLE